MTCYSVLEVTPTSQDWVEPYVSVSTGLVAKHGGRYLARTSNHQRLEGEGQDPALRIILQWPSKEAAVAFMNDPEYVPHLKARTDGSASQHFLIAGKDDLVQ